MGFRLLFWGWYIAKSERVKVTFGKNYSFFSKDTNSDSVASDPK
jgi:hypothetical protein